MDTKKLKINIPEGYEIDIENSTFEEIVFKKVDSLSNLPETWEEYCKQTVGCKSYFHTRYPEPCIRESPSFDGVYCEFSTEERVKQYVALGKLLQLRDYWVKDHNFVNGIGYNIRRFIDYLVIYKCNADNYALTFPTQEMAQKFIECFEDLIEEAHPLVLK